MYKSSKQTHTNEKEGKLKIIIEIEKRKKKYDKVTK